MIAALVFALALGAATPELSADARAAIAPVLDAIAAEQAAQANLPPPKDDREKLIRMGRLDQASRLALGRVDFGKAPEAERGAARRAMAAAMDEIDKTNQADLLGMVPAEGWFYASRWGEEASRAAFHIVQHGKPGLWRRFVPVLEPLVASGEVRGPDYALMHDRLAMVEGRPQRYGSQFRCVDGRFQVHTLEDPARVDEFRRSMGFRDTFAEYAAAFERMKFPC